VSSRIMRICPDESWLPKSTRPRLHVEIARPAPKKHREINEFGTPTRPPNFAGNSLVA
jgi:hypothetical protein